MSTFDLGKVSKGDAGAVGDFAQGATLALTNVTKDVTDFMSKDYHLALLFVSADLAL
ncbi:hypothetical protein GCM10009715_21020 [Paeniglutamicibacter psychrophenolicus]